jgi:hypothetical protein
MAVLSAKRNCATFFVSVKMRSYKIKRATELGHVRVSKNTVLLKIVAMLFDGAVRLVMHLLSAIAILSILSP